MIISRIVPYATLLGILAVWLVLVMGTLTSPRYGEIGDEGIFYGHALAAYENGVDNPFSRGGVYQIHPVMNSVYHAGVMRVFGADRFGWKMAGVVSVATASIGLFALGWQLLDRTAGLLAAFFMLSSHYLFGFVHIGYGNVDILPPIVWSMVVSLLAIKHSPHWWPFLGLVCAWGLAMHSAGVMAVGGAVMAILAYSTWREWWRCWPAVVVGGIAVAPTLVDLGLHREIWKQSIGGYDGGVTGHRWERIIWSLVYNTRAWVRNTHHGHHVRGALIDPITLALAFVGVWRAPLLVLGWLAMSWAAATILSPHPLIATSRLFVMIPPLALLAAFGSKSICTSFARPFARHLQSHYRGRAVVLLGLAVVWLNLYIHTGDW